MSAMLPTRVSKFFCYSTAVFFAAGTCLAGPPMVDLNGDGMSDIWELIYDANGVDPNADSDSDGVINRLEAIAGTNPFDATSFPQISFGTYLGTNFSVTFPCALGKQYQLESVPSMDSVSSTNWFTETNTVVRSGSTLTLTGTVGSTAKFYRISINDVDTDGDGVNDWEEYQLGLDPFNPYSNGTMDSNGKPVNDYNYVVGKLAVQNLVWISATGPTAIQPDPGQTSTSPGQFTLTRGGFPLNSITVNLSQGGPGTGYGIPGVDFLALPSALTLPAGVSSQSFLLKPLSNPNLTSSVIAQMNVMSGSGYSVSGSNNATVVIYPTQTANGSGLTGLYFTNSSSTYSSPLNFNPTNLVMTRIDPMINFLWGNFTNPFPNAGVFSVRWVGQIEPQYSETYVFDANTDDGVNLWVNDQLIISDWKAQGATDSLGSIALQAGARYDIKMEYFQGGGGANAYLSWYSPSQPKQIIPSNRLFPTNVAPAPTTITSPLIAYAFLGQPFSYPITAANNPMGYVTAGLPPGLILTNGTISGVPTVAGNFQTMIVASNAIGSSAAAVTIQVINTGSAVTQEIWSNVPGVDVADIPVNTPANATNALGGLQGITGYGQNYAERIQGYFTAPVTGNYYFWIAGSDSAELWISNDNDPVNKVKRAYVLPTPNPTAPPANGTSPQQWNLQPNQRSGWLSLVAGQPYYVEVLHKAGAGTNDNWSVGWLQDPVGAGAAPVGVTPGYLLSRYFTPPPSTIPGTLYSAQLLTLPGVASTAAGTATLRVSADGSQAVLNFQLQNLSSSPSSEEIVSDPYLADPNEVLYDISASRPQTDGSYLWVLGPAGPLAISDIQEIINEGKAAINIATGTYPNGELSGHFTPVNGSQTFNPPPVPPVWVDDSANSNAAARFLIQASYGPTPADVATVQSLGYAGWISNQMGLPATHALPMVLANRNTDPTDPFPSTDWFNTWWENSVTAPDQLRQRVAFALSEIMVVSENNGALTDNATALASYYDTLLDNAFGNYRTLLEAVTLTPAMGLYLNMQGNAPGNVISGLHANENYAREIQQLFSIGLYRLWPDGTLVMNGQGNLVPTYGQNEIMGFASAFTGWNFYQPNQANGRLPSNFYPPANYTNPMVLVPKYHELGTKQVLDNVTLPPALGSQTNSANTNFDYYGSQDLESALDSIFNNQNVGPFICRELIQRLVTSNPSRDYLYRVAQTFNDNGAGVRGDMQAVIRAILLDYEARSSDLLNEPTYGKQRESLLRVTAAARGLMPPPPNSGTYAQNGTNQVVMITTANPHRLNNGDVVVLSFADTSGNPAPPTQAYGVTVTGTSSFNINAPGISSGTYGQTNSTITVNISGHGLLPGNPVYLVFPTGGAVSGLFQVASTNSANSFNVAAVDSATRNGTVVMPKITGGGYVQVKTNITFSMAYPHGLSPGYNVFINFNGSGPANGQYQVLTVPDAMHFTIVVTNSANQTSDSETIYPLAPPSITRSGNVLVEESTYNMGYTDGGGSSSLPQSPLRATTVFNFYHPSYEFPGPLAAAGLTTPEFELTSDTTVTMMMNFMEGSILGNTGNTNGLSSFTGGNGALVLDVGPWMTPTYTAAAGLPTLVGGLNSLLVAGQMSAAAQADIVNYVSTNFPYNTNTPPTDTQMRDRVRAVVHLIINSPDFAIQK